MAAGAQHNAGGSREHPSVVVEQQLAKMSVDLSVVVLDEDLQDGCLKDTGAGFVVIARKGDVVWTAARSLFVMTEPWAGKGLSITWPQHL